ncbi:PAS domain-containing sensor histidine kinase [Halovenus marina]|uniref:PAS domain-containing sensor histidine kinase n=1 Tax=Halovenus marina TaxID=3396621 RepID=UPI003F557138
MLSSVTVVYVGTGGRGVDILDVLEDGTTHPVQVVTAGPDSLTDLLGPDRLDGVLCGPELDGADLQTVVFETADTADDLPVVNLTGESAAVPERLDVYDVERDADPENLARTVLGAVLDAQADDDEHDPGTLGQYLAVNSEWEITDWDPRLESWTGIRPSAALGEEIWNVIPSWEETELAEACTQVMQSRDATTAEVLHRPTERWFDARVVPRSTGGIECFLHDITGYREQVFDDPQERFENTLDRITDAFFELDTEERLVFLNSQAEFLLDVDSEEVTGMRFWDAFPAAVSTTFYQEFQGAMDSQEPTSFEEFYHPLERWFEVNAYPSEDGLSVFLRDVTEQVELQQKLERLHEITRELIVAESDVDIAERAVDAAEEVLEFPLVVVWQHDEATEMLDPVAYSEAIDDRVDALEPLGRESTFIWEVYETENPRSLGFVPATTSTSHHPGKVTSELLVPAGEAGVLSAYSDERDAFDETDVELFRILANTVASAFARTERERQLARRNERLNDFASVVSHDLRNPLNVASAHAELAREASETADHLDKIETSLDRMERLIEDLLARAQGDRGLDRESLSLSDLAQSAWDGVDTAAATLSVEGDAALHADSDRLRQLFENLYRNSVEHGGEAVEVSVGPLDSGFYVDDDGSGIPESERESVFEQGVTHADDGTGYGLAIVSDIVDGHGWSISVAESAEGGARFEVAGVRSLSRTQP